MARLRARKFVPHVNEVRKPQNTPTQAWSAPGTTSGTRVQVTRSNGPIRSQVPSLTDADLQAIDKASSGRAEVAVIRTRAHIAAWK